MKNIYSAVVAFALVVGAGACTDYNGQFEGLTESAKPSDVRSENITLTEDDYSAFSGLDGNYFSADKPASDYLPSYLSDLYPTVDDGSAIKVTYNYQDVLPGYLLLLSEANDYTISSNDYVTVWGDVEATYFTPERKFSSYASKLLAAAYPDAQDGEIKVVEYNYSSTEPSAGGASTAITVTEIYEDFTTVTEDSSVDMVGWINYAETGDEYWVGDLYDSNGYIQCSAYGASGEVAAWLVSPLVDFSSATAPKFSLDVKTGYANGATLSILISEDFNGSESGITSATWTDITSNFYFNEVSGTYGSFDIAGLMDMADYVGKKFYIAFKYSGDGANSKTTTFQIDNIELGEDSSVAEVEDLSESFAESLGDWTNETTVGSDLEWSQDAYSSDSYAKISSYGKSGEQVAYLISPEFLVSTGAKLSFDLLVGHWNADCMTVLISKDYTDSADSATWDDITASFTLPQEPTSGYGSFATAGSYALSSYEGESVRIAFKYVGDGDNSQTTTYEITNILVSSLSRVPTSLTSTSSSIATVVSKSTDTRAIDGVHTLEAVYTYNGSAWVAYDDTLSISSDNYAEMGLTQFSSSALPEVYVPIWLKSEISYAVEGDVVAVVYDYSSERQASEFTYTNGTWVINDGIIQQTDQYVKANLAWAFDPSVVITIAPGYSSAVAAIYYQAVVDWVWENIDVAQLGCTTTGQGYVSSYGNNDYYTGCSAYYANIDLRASAATSQYPAGFTGMSDDEIQALMIERMLEVFGYALGNVHPDAKQVDGIDVIYTIYVAVYEGTSVSAVTHSMQYLVVGDGEFEYIEDSFQEL